MKFTTQYSDISDVFRKMSKRDLKEFHQGFLDNIEPCIADLASHVRASPNSQDWTPNLHPDSLNAVGEWVGSHLETRPLTVEEIDRVEKSLKHPMDFPKKTYTRESLSLIVMLGMYLGETFIKQFPFLKWDLDLTRRDGVDYGQAVISGFKYYPLNPVSIIGTFASRYTFNDDGEKQPEPLKASYDVWAKMIPENS